MNLIYEGTDITKDVEIHRAELIDTSGGKSDSIEVCFSDVSGHWSKWKPQKNDKIIISENGLSSGVMYIDEIEQQRGMFIIRALSLPQACKTQNTRSWESIRFLELAADIALKHGFKIESYGIENYLYTRVDQFEQADFEFLLYRCILEGYMLKISDSKVTIYNESYLENQSTNKFISIEEFDGRYKFKTKSTDIFNSCEVTYDAIKGVYNPNKPPYGPILKYHDIYVHSNEEANRFAKNLLRNKNKFENTGSFNIKLDTGIASGINIKLSGIGLSDGKYFCHETKHNFINNKTSLNVRIVLEGY